MSEAQAEVPIGDPMRDAWEAYRLTDEYRNTLRWAIYPEHAPGSLWAAFVAGWQADRKLAEQERERWIDRIEKGSSEDK